MNKTSVIYRVIIGLILICLIPFSLALTAMRWIKDEIYSHVDIIKGFKFLDAAHREVDRKQIRVNNFRAIILRLKDKFK